ncbi:MAG: acyl CoA:acetate/3-ketoacid CoA transferase [Peptococcaceae bacterium]|jgi:propionate CoA-transferase|nr:acyl CoA:acetate/3-ketoacid CoA transferase [Peptococcaceae bacterium]
MANKVIGAREAIDWIKDGDTLGVTGAGLRGTPEYLLKTLEDKFHEAKSPRDLTLFSVVGHGAFDNRGDARVAYPGLLKRFIGTHPDTCIRLREMIGRNECEAYIFPQGPQMQLLRAIAEKGPGFLTKIGIGTYVDPRIEGAKCNDKAKAAEDLIEVVNLRGEEWLLFKSMPIDVAFIRGTTADENGNLSIEHECNWLEVFELANAVKSSGGKVIVQVKRVVKNGSIHPHHVVLPGVLVDAVVICEDWEHYHMMNDAVAFNEAFTGNYRVPTGAMAAPKETISARDAILRRAAMELWPGAVVNMGFGITGGVGEVAEAEGLIESLTLTVELGLFGGMPGKFPNFGAVINAEAFISMSNMFNYYHAGNLEICFLGSAQVDAHGSSNVSKFGSRVVGPGGFIDITTCTPNVVICLPFTSKGLEEEVAGGKLVIKQEGKIKKFVNTLDQVSFNGEIASKNGKKVTYITERGVFKLLDGQLTLTEIAPGVDLEKDILANMEFRPVISPDLKLIDERVFRPGRMNCFELDQ